MTGLGQAHFSVAKMHSECIYTDSSLREQKGGIPIYPFSPFRERTRYFFTVFLQILNDFAICATVWPLSLSWTIASERLENPDDGIFLLILQ
ncbi:hypothetical protein DLJ82_6179 (plasmid) [Rhizobium leguminosarum]|uniref:Uncharacterized protein n=1 Tax=Rhizobium leguminosarum TaxID=384 RepID=A0A2Z4YS14_RHILE|nr:hypothetical protein [Rhizobium leguminosarum]AXA44150.1 hypothetical protein DLJ82_6179 [Rhizobium leguminosarum]